MAPKHKEQVCASMYLSNLLLKGSEKDAMNCWRKQSLSLKAISALNFHQPFCSHFQRLFLLTKTKTHHFIIGAVLIKGRNGDHDYAKFLCDTNDEILIAFITDAVVLRTDKIAAFAVEHG